MQSLFSEKNIISMSSAELAQRVVKVNLFQPEFMKWTLPSLNLETSTAANRDGSKNKKQCSVTVWQTV